MGILLASASPRRAELLRAAGIVFETCPAHVDESLEPGESAEQYSLRVARAKCQAVADSAPIGSIVIGADTVVVVEDTVLGKPRDAADARRMLQLLSGRTHTVLTAVAMAAVGTSEEEQRTWSAVVPSRVEFDRLSEDDIAWYVASGEPMDKAGAYAIQGLGSRFITRIEGSYANVVGLPVHLVFQWLRDVGWHAPPARAQEARPGAGEPV